MLDPEPVVITSIPEEGYTGTYQPKHIVAVGDVSLNVGELSLGGTLKVSYDNGNAGQRMSLTGATADDMPYFQVVARTRTGTDGGAAVAGYQLHLGPDSGGGINREFFFIEAVGELHPLGPHFRIGTHASGNGVRRPLYIKGGDASAFKFDESGSITAFQPIVWEGDIQTAIKATRDGGNQTILHSVVYNATAGTTAATFLGHSSGTKASPGAPGSGFTLGSYQFGAMNGTSTVTSAQIRSVSTESWTFGTAQGSRLEFLIQRSGTATSIEGLRIAAPTTDQVGIMVLVNRAGVTTSSQVTIGAADSAGAGFRQLRVAN